jgi:hypothetical protein
LPKNTIIFSLLFSLANDCSHHSHASKTPVCQLRFAARKADQMEKLKNASLKNFSALHASVDAREDAKSHGLGVQLPVLLVLERAPAARQVVRHGVQ